MRKAERNVPDGDYNRERYWEYSSYPARVSWIYLGYLVLALTPLSFIWLSLGTSLAISLAALSLGLGLAALHILLRREERDRMKTELLRREIVCRTAQSELSQLQREREEYDEVLSIST